MESRALPPRPSLEQYRKQAKNLWKACASADPRVLHGWVAHWVECRAGEQSPLEEIARIEQRIAESKLAKPDPRLADAQFFLARLHGFESWSKFARHVQVLEQSNSQEASFEAAADAVVSGDLQTLEQLLRKYPRLISARSARTHNGTLLHYVAANGIEDFRKKTPQNIVAIARLLLHAGAEVNAKSSAYGGGCTALGLVATSVHPERAGVQDALLQMLIDHGAEMDQPGSGGSEHTVLESCLWNGRGRAAAFLAWRGAQLNLETAAGTGRIDVVMSCFSEDGKIQPFLQTERLQRGFLWACEYGYQDVVEFLLDHGADLRDPAGTRQTALHWAVAGGHLPIVNVLLKHGAPLEERNAYGATALGQAGWSFLNGDPQIDFLPIFEALLDAGAKVEDGWLTWLEQQHARPAAERTSVAELFRRYGASS